MSDQTEIELHEALERGINRRQLLERGLALGVSVSSLGAILEGCGDGLDGGRFGLLAASKQFVYTTGTDAVTLDPHAAPDIDYTFNLCRGPAEALVEYVVHRGNHVTAGPRLAKSWHHNENATVWDFTLNKGVKFQDGTPFNAAAVKANIERILALNLVPAGRLGQVTSVQAVNDHTVRFRLPAPTANLLYPLSMMLMISPSAWQAHDVNGDRGQAWAASNIVGTGPYLISSRTKGSQTVMKRWPGYWRHWKGHHVDTVVIDVAPDAGTRLLKLINGEAALAKGLATSALPQILHNPNIVVSAVQAPGVQMAACRFSGPLADVNVRRAITWCFDGTGFAKAALQGQGNAAHGLMYTQFPYFDKRIPPYKQNMARARQYLAASAYPRGGFTLSFLILPGYAPFQSDLATAWQADLAQLNIKLDIRPMASVASYYASVQDPKGADLWAWLGSAQTPDHVFQARRQWATGYEYPKGVNGGYSNPKFDSLMDKIAATDQPTKLKPLWAQVQQILARDLPFIPFFIPTQFMTKRKGWKGLPQNPFDFVPNYYDVYNV